VFCRNGVYNSTCSECYTEVSGQLYTSAILLSGKEIPVFTVETRAGLDVWREE
jgi:hypothetical protein